ncbi:L,D-transpeptidase family protein [Microvirga massiliensis]|uniref:L,D-transpeptidase family protein n=1 Tax=Microvirga massiliensis TaxID=1033741 RepID=UPI00062B5317|nr:L,D-transpeptidase [Microvirga massiliensis]
MRHHPSVILFIVALFAAPGALAAERLKPKDIETAQFMADSPSRAMTAKLQILLDQARFSPGVIDGHMGENVELAIAAYRAAHGLGEDSKVDEATWNSLSENYNGPVLKEYKITKDDVDGPFTKKIPASLEEQAKLKRLSYTGPRELLAEKFHMDEDFLEELNPGARFDKAGTTITVAAVGEENLRDPPKVSRVEIDKARKQLRVYAEDQTLFAVYPATIGSESRPAPSGEFKVEEVVKHPNYTYNPDYEFKGVEAKKPFTIAPGPNNPVGSIWIQVAEDGYGIHGTPEPSKIGKTFSHGCVRLTNWDAEELARLVKKGTPVIFLDPPGGEPARSAAGGRP